MAHVDWKMPIEAVHGKLFKGFGAAKRKSPNAEGEQPNYSVFYGERKKAVSSDETAARTRWGAIAKMVANRRKNATQRSADIVAFNAQTAIPTMRKYLWSVCITEYNQAHPQA